MCACLDHLLRRGIAIYFQYWGCAWNLVPPIQAGHKKDEYSMAASISLSKNVSFPHPREQVNRYSRDFSTRMSDYLWSLRTKACTVNAKLFSTTLPLPFLSSNGVIRLHDNALPHVAKACQYLPRLFHWQALYHLPIAPTCFPSTSTSSHWKQVLEGRRFVNDVNRSWTLLNTGSAGGHRTDVLRSL